MYGRPAKSYELRFRIGPSNEKRMWNKRAVFSNYTPHREQCREAAQEPAFASGSALVDTEIALVALSLLRFVQRTRVPVAHFPFSSSIRCSIPKRLGDVLVVNDDPALRRRRAGVRRHSAGRKSGSKTDLNIMARGTTVLEPEAAGLGEHVKPSAADFVTFCRRRRSFTEAPQSASACGAQRHSNDAPSQVVTRKRDIFFIAKRSNLSRSRTFRIERLTRVCFISTTPRPSIRRKGCGIEWCRPPLARSGDRDGKVGRAGIGPRIPSGGPIANLPALARVTVASPAALPGRAPRDVYVIVPAAMAYYAHSTRGDWSIIVFSVFRLAGRVYTACWRHARPAGASPKAHDGNFNIGNDGESGRATLWPTCLQHGDGPVRTVRCHTLTEYGREVAPSVVVLRPVNKSCGDPLPLRHISYSFLKCQCIIDFSEAASIHGRQ
ncbi:hypothetical protein EVAR_24487_1 [Eumeta japonica]|uniref:Uncharacterized protein n=1 Tax=Eumeta variegata TaxID=151549 RepID=A0A4C1WVD4_EUMVA|nr:hypothetical protein EVAR_24487_1 [Eumeta japonica]